MKPYKAVILTIFTSISIIVIGIMICYFFLTSANYKDKLQLVQTNNLCIEQYEVLDSMGAFVIKDMSYTITECRKIGGEMTQYTQYIPPSVALNPIPENYLCGTGGVLLGRKNSDAIGEFCCKYKKQTIINKIIVYNLILQFIH